MSFIAEITERSLSRDRQAVLTDVLVRELNVEREEAELTALVMPAVVGPFGSAADRDAFLVALAEAGFAARPVSDPAYAPPAYVPPVYTQPAYVPPAQPAYVPPASPPEGYAPAEPLPSNNGTIIGIAILLAVIAAALAVVLLTRDTRDEIEQPVTEATPPPRPDDPQPEPEPVPAPDPPADDYVRYGFSPSRGVNRDVFTTSEVTRYASAPNGTPIPIRDMPSVRHGTAIGEVAPGSSITTSGCLPRRPEDGGRWCEVDGAGWIYDRYLTSAPPRQPPPPQPSPPQPSPPQPPRPTADVASVIVMGSYAPDDEAGLKARYALAQQTGLTLQIVPASTYGMTGDYRVIVAGPYDRDTALRLLDQARAYVPDAFRKALD